MNVRPGFLLRNRLLDHDHVPNPGFVDTGVSAVAREQRNGHARDTSQQNLVDGFFQHIQTCHANDRIDIPANNNFQDHWRSLGHKDFVAHLFGFGSKVGDAASTAFLAIHTKLVVVCRASLGVLQAVRKQEKTTAWGRCGYCVAKEFGADHHHDPAHIALGHTDFFQRPTSDLLELIFGRRHLFVHPSSHFPTFISHLFSQERCLGNKLQMTGFASRFLF